jgi:DNA topoisomerase-1
LEPEAAAQAAGLRYVTDRSPGIRRRRAGRGFTYLDPQGRVLQNGDLSRIRALAVPPGWTDVWICASPSGHIQATGRDARGRKQYRYHPRWREIRDATKFDRMIAFGTALPSIRRRTAKDLARTGLPREKVLAAVVRLLESTLIRVGNPEYAKENESFGLTTLRERHVSVEGSTIEFHFRGKGGKLHRVDVRDPRLARVVRQCQDIPGYELFQYVDEDGERQRVDSEDVNDYLREISGQDFTAKDFRTWAGTVGAAMALREFEPFETEAEGKRNVVEAIETVAERLRNTPTVCRACYIHPALLESYLDGSMGDVPEGRTIRGLEPEEAFVLRLLEGPAS